MTYAALLLLPTQTLRTNPACVERPQRCLTCFIGHDVAVCADEVQEMCIGLPRRETHRNNEKKRLSRSGPLHNHIVFFYYTVKLYVEGYSERFVYPLPDQCFADLAAVVLWCTGRLSFATMRSRSRLPQIGRRAQVLSPSQTREC